MDTSTEIRQRLEEARTDRERLFAEIENLRARAEADGDTDGIAERLANMNRAVAKADGQIDELEARYGRMRYAEHQAGDPRNLEAGSTPERTAHRTGRNPERDAALEAVDRN